LEVPDVVGRQLRDAVNVHACGRPGVMDLDALDFVRDQKPPPTSCTSRLSGRNSKSRSLEPISIARTGGSIPELAEDL